MNAITRRAPAILDWVAAAFGFRRSDGAEQAPGNTIADVKLRKWNWGAGVLAPFWAFSHGLRLIGLVTLICWFAPLQPVAVIAGILLGIFGNRLAARNRRFTTQESFDAIESTWSKWGLATFAALVIYVIWTWISSRSS